jgi:hypothetical protein
VKLCRFKIALPLLLAAGVATAHADETVVDETLRVAPAPNDAFHWPYAARSPSDWRRRCWCRSSRGQ